jgi:hypothetical protein
MGVAGHDQGDMVPVPSKFIQITVGPGCDDGDIYALDESGQVWVLKPYTPTPRWVAVTSERFRS